MKTLKKLALTAALTLATSTAFADITIGGSNTQTTSADNIINTALGYQVVAEQIVASNRGNVKIQGDNHQTVTAKNIINTALGYEAKAIQVLSSNISTPTP